MAISTYLEVWGSNTVALVVVRNHKESQDADEPQVLGQAVEDNGCCLPGCLQDVQGRKTARKHSRIYRIQRDIRHMDLNAGPYNFHIPAQGMVHIVAAVASVELEVLDENSEWVA